MNKAEIDFLLALGTMFEDKSNTSNDTGIKCKTIDTLAFSRARESYMNVLKIDPLNVKANYNLGILYHNFAVKLLMNMPPDVMKQPAKYDKRDAHSESSRCRDNEAHW